MDENTLIEIHKLLGELRACRFIKEKCDEHIGEVSEKIGELVQEGEEKEDDTGRNF